METNEFTKCNRFKQNKLTKSKMSSSNQLSSHVFSDGKWIRIQVEMAQSQIGNNNNNMLVHLPPVSRTHDQIA